jgi:hypothetical protein
MSLDALTSQHQKLESSTLLNPIRRSSHRLIASIYRNTLLTTTLSPHLLSHFRCVHQSHNMPPARGPVPVRSERDLPHEILAILADNDSCVTTEAFREVPQPEIKSAIDRLASRSMVLYETNDTELVLLTQEALTICEDGSHEYKVWDAVKRLGKIAVKDLPV